MKKIFFLLLILATTLFVTDEAFAQKKKKKGGSSKGNDKEAEAKGNDKDEEKKWKKKKNDMDPLAFKRMYEEYGVLKNENAALKRQVEKCQGDLESAQSSVSSKDQQIADLQAKADQMQADFNSAMEQQKQQKDKEQDVTAGGDDYTRGIVYKVQIGAFRNKALSKYQNVGKFWEEDIDGVKKYTIGYFRDYNEANTFKEYLRDMGVKDAWIVAYENNQRKDVKEVMNKSGQKVNE